MKRIRIFQQKDGNSIYTKDLIRNPNVRAGEFTYGQPVIHSWDDSTRLEIGKFCSIADNVHFFLGGNHRTDWVSTYPFNVLSAHFPNAATITGHPATKGDIQVGHDVWIGSGAVILSGVTIGNGAVIGANAVIASDVAPYQVAVGNPMKIIKSRFSAEQIADLQMIAWWNWDENKINENITLICSDNIQNFINAHKPGNQ
jgi:acetyltransferase-like isoleucine patch superfamily enzyme